MLLIVFPIVLVLMLPKIFDKDMEYAMSELRYYATSIHTSIGSAGKLIIGLGIVSFIVTMPSMVTSLEKSFEHSDKKKAIIKEK